jgi:hypothetical protein
MLDSPFLFVENGDKVDTYCLSYPVSSSKSSRPVPSSKELYIHGVMRMLTDEAEARQAFETFCACPLAKMICECNDDAEGQQRNAQIIDTIARPQKKQATMPTREATGGGAQQQQQQQQHRARSYEDDDEEERAEKRLYLEMGKDGRKAVFCMDSTLATYTERFGQGWMGQMMLESVANVHTFRSPVPVEGLALDRLLNRQMKIQRIESIRVQWMSTLLLKRAPSVALTTHRFSEKKLCKPINEYESMGWVTKVFRR